MNSACLVVVEKDFYGDPGFLDQYAVFHHWDNVGNRAQNASLNKMKIYEKHGE